MGRKPLRGLGEEPEEEIMIETETEVVQRIADAFEAKYRLRPSALQGYFLQKEAASLEAWPYAKLPNGSYDVSLQRQLAESAHDELVKRGVIKPDNRRHAVIGQLSGAWRINRSWWKGEGS